MARKIIYRENGLANQPSAPQGFRYVGYDGNEFSEKFGITISTIGGGGGGINLYNTDGTLTGNRIVTGGSYSLTFTQIDQYTSNAEAHTFKNITGNNNLFKLTSPATFGSNYIQFGRNNIDNNCGQIYSNDVSVNMQYNTGNVIASIFANGFKVGGNGAVAPTSRFDVISPSTSALDVAFSVRNSTDTDYLFSQLGDGEWTTKTTVASKTYTFGYTDQGLGSGFPVLLIDAPSGGTSAMILRQNGNRVFQFGSLGASDFALLATKPWYIRDLASNNNQAIKNTNGEWLFTNDATGTQNPEAGVRAKFYGTVKIVSPTSSVSGTAFSIRNSVDTSDLIQVKGDGILFTENKYSEYDTQYTSLISPKIVSGPAIFTPNGTAVPDFTKFNNMWALTIGNAYRSAMNVIGDNVNDVSAIVSNLNSSGTSELWLGGPSYLGSLGLVSYGASNSQTHPQNSNLSLASSVNLKLNTTKVFLTSSIGGNKIIYNMNETGSGYVSQKIDGFGIYQDVNTNMHLGTPALFAGVLRNHPPSGYQSRLLWLENLTDYTSNSGSQDLVNIVNNATVGIGLTLSGTMLLVDDQINSNMNLFRVKKQGQDKLIIDPNGRIGINSSSLSSTRMYVLANNGEYAGYFDANDSIAGYFNSVSDRGIYAISNSSIGIQGINVDGSQYGIVALGKFDGTGKALIASGEVKFISPTASSLGTAFSVRNSTDTVNYVQTVGSGTTVFRTDNAQQVDSIQAYAEGAFADKYPGLFINNCIATGSKPALRAVSQGAGSNSENYGIFAIAQNGLANNTGVRGQGYGATSILGIGIQGSTEAGWGAGGYFTAPSGNAEAFSTITTSKNLHKKFTNGTGLPAVNNLDGQFGAGVMAGVIVVESTTGLTICISNGTNWIDIRTNAAVVI